MRLASTVKPSGIIKIQKANVQLVKDFDKQKEQYIKVCVNKEHKEETEKSMLKKQNVKLAFITFR